MITRKSKEKWHFLIFLTGILGLFLSIFYIADFLTNNEFQFKKMHSDRISETRVTFCDNFYFPDMEKY